MINLKSKEPRLRDWNPDNVIVDESSMSAWNQKNLDYEIETFFSRLCSIIGTVLKSKEPRLRDWNTDVNQDPPFHSKLEIKRTSITRLKPRTLRFEGRGVGVLEIKRTSITRLKPLGRRGRDKRTMGSPWNQKNLDYEIETHPWSGQEHWIGGRLEIKRTSITRLKQYPIQKDHLQVIDLKSKEPRLRDWNMVLGAHVLPNRVATWNQKNLDYEIETVQKRWFSFAGVLLEIKRTSITRLKPQTFCRNDYRRYCAWNQKNLDYEIETPPVATHLPVYWVLEIKRTSITRLKLATVFENRPIFKLEIKRTSITRLKLLKSSWRRCGKSSFLKSKEPRLRDWNSEETRIVKQGVWHGLEIKRTSITRLKQNFIVTPIL